MLEYELIIHITDANNIVMKVEYEKEYNLKQDITNLGVNGITQKDGENYVYYPSYRIEKIEAKKIR